MSWLVVDAPDFDGIHAPNRKASERLVITADLLLVVVTPQSYQNRTVVEFLRAALKSGKPYALIYNQGQDPNDAQRHLAKLARDIGSEPLASFFGPHDRKIQEGEALLLPRRLANDAHDGNRATLAEWLEQPSRARTCTELATSAALEALGADLLRLDVDWSEATDRPRALLDTIEERLRPHAEAVARALFPVQPFREALQAQLDRRSMAHRSVRYVPARAGDILRRGFASVSSWVGAEAATVPSKDRFRAEELRLLQGGQPADGSGEVAKLDELWETMHAEIQRAAGAVSRATADDDFAPQRRSHLRDELRSRHARLHLPFDDFRAASERSIEHELETRDAESGLQWAYTALKVLPPLATVAVMALTGAVGDIGAGLTYLVAEPLLDRAAGRDLVRHVHQQWWQQRTEALVALLVGTLLPACSQELADRVAAYEEGSLDLRRLSAEIMQPASPGTVAASPSGGNNRAS